MHLIDENCLPDNHLLISVGEGSLSQYTLCGLDFVYVRGMIENHPTMGEWFRLIELDHVNEQIADYVLAQTDLSAAHFRFLRKEAGLSIGQICVELDLDVADVEAWEAGSGFTPQGAEGIRGIYNQFRKLGYAAFLQARTAMARAA